MQTREFHGFRQYRETSRCRWRFYIIGFDSTPAGEHGICYVLRADDSRQAVPIDPKSRILIGGRRYGRDQWDH